MKTCFKLLLVFCSLFLGTQLAFAEEEALAVPQAEQVNADRAQCKAAVVQLYAKMHLAESASAQDAARQVREYYKQAGAKAKQQDREAVRTACAPTIQYLKTKRANAAKAAVAPGAEPEPTTPCWLCVFLNIFLGKDTCTSCKKMIETQ